MTTPDIQAQEECLKILTVQDLYIYAEKQVNLPGNVFQYLEIDNITPEKKRAFFL